MRTLRDHLEKIEQLTLELEGGAPQERRSGLPGLLEQAADYARLERELAALGAELLQAARTNGLDAWIGQLKLFYPSESSSEVPKTEELADKQEEEEATEEVESTRADEREAPAPLRPFFKPSKFQDEVDVLSSTYDAYVEEQLGLDVLKHLGKSPTIFRSKGNVRAEVERLTGLDIAPWVYLSAKKHVLLAHWIVARARAVQDALALEFAHRSDDAEALASFFSLVGEHIMRHRPGFIWGLMREHQPKHGGDWLEEAQHFEAVIRQWLDEEEVLRPEPERAKPVKVAQHEEESDGEVERASEASVFDGWPGLAYTQGKRALIVGGQAKASRQEALTQCFGFEQLEWLNLKPRQVQAVAERIRRGQYDLVFVLRAWSRHSYSKAIFAQRAEAAELGCHVILTDGYGQLQLKQGMERFLDFELGESQT